VEDPSNVKRDRGADYMKCYAANFSTTDLTAEVGYPDHEAFVDLYNANAAAQTAVLVDKRGTSHTIIVPPGQHYPVEIPVATLHTDSHADISAKVYWWACLGHTINPAP
jgi:hypothetical protein